MRVWVSSILPVVLLIRLIVLRVCVICGRVLISFILLVIFVGIRLKSIRHLTILKTNLIARIVYILLTNRVSLWNGISVLLYRPRLVELIWERPLGVSDRRTLLYVSIAILIEILEHEARISAMLTENAGVIDVFLNNMHIRYVLMPQWLTGWMRYVRPPSSRITAMVHPKPSLTRLVVCGVPSAVAPNYLNVLGNQPTEKRFAVERKLVCIRIVYDEAAVGTDDFEDSKSAHDIESFCWPVHVSRSNA
jgi:hypothetical protein